MKYLFKLWHFIKSYSAKKIKRAIIINQSIKKNNDMTTTQTFDMNGVYDYLEPAYTKPVFIPRKHTVCTYANQKRNAQKRKYICKH